MVIYTIGHSILNIDDFINTLKTYKISILVDVRSLPGSQYVPAFNQENLVALLEKNGITYIHLPILGGRRKSGNAEHCTLVSGWKMASFRNYASYTLTDEYRQGIDHLISIAERSICCMMCAESVPWRCHRSIIANTLVHMNIKTLHILSKDKTVEHRLNLYGARSTVRDGRLIYPE